MRNMYGELLVLTRPKIINSDDEAIRIKNEIERVSKLPNPGEDHIEIIKLLDLLLLDWDSRKPTTQMSFLDLLTHVLGPDRATWLAKIIRV